MSGSESAAPSLAFGLPALSTSFEAFSLSVSDLKFPSPASDARIAYDIGMDTILKDSPEAADGSRPAASLGGGEPAFGRSNSQRGDGNNGHSYFPTISADVRHINPGLLAKRAFATLCCALVRFFGVCLPSLFQILPYVAAWTASALALFGFVFINCKLIWPARTI